MRLSGKLVDIYIEKTKPGDSTKVLVVVGTKISKKAVSRNLIKRRLRAASFFFKDKFRSRLVKLVAKPTIIKAKFSEIKSEIEVLLVNYNEKSNY